MPLTQKLILSVDKMKAIRNIPTITVTVFVEDINLIMVFLMRKIEKYKKQSF